MVFPADFWKRKPLAVAQPMLPTEIKNFLDRGEGGDGETLVPEPDWEENAPERAGSWQRPLLFAVAGGLLLAVGSYTLTNDWWLARQQQGLDRQLTRTASAIQAGTVEKTTHLQESLDALLNEAGRVREPAAPAVLPVAPPVPSAPRMLAPPPPPTVNRLPPLPPLLPVRPPAPPPALLPAQPQVVAPPPPKVALIGGNDRIVLLDIEGERVQLAPGQVGPRDVAVIAVESRPERYSVRVRLPNGRPLVLNLDFNPDIVRSDDAPPPAAITPLY